MLIFCCGFAEGIALYQTGENRPPPDAVEGWVRKRLESHNIANNVVIESTFYVSPNAPGWKKAVYTLNSVNGWQVVAYRRTLKEPKIKTMKDCIDALKTSFDNFTIADDETSETIVGLVN